MKLYPYQIEGAGFLAGRRLALLADEMGLGKSAQAITAADITGAQTGVILCPANARINWQREIAQFSLFSPKAAIMESARDLAEPNGFTICSYSLLTEPAVIEKLAALRPDVLILDECHLLVNRKAGRTKAVYERLAKLAGRIWWISGTPAPNDPSELWPMLRVAGVFKGDYWAFVKEFCTGYDAAHGHVVTGARQNKIPRLKAMLEGFMLRRRKEDVMTELPPLTYDYIYVEPGPVDWEIHFPNYIHSGGEEKLKADVEKQAAAIGAMMEISEADKAKALEALEGSGVSAMRRYYGIQKVESLAKQIAHDLDHGIDKIVVMAVHRDVIEGLRERLGKYKPVTLYGGTPAQKKQNNIDKFQKDPKCRVFIGQVVAAGTAITLTAACELIFAEQSYVPGENAQAAMRVHRLGQTRPVRVRIALLKDSIDAKVGQILKRKTKDLTQIFD